MNDAMILDTEAAVMANFAFLAQTDVEMSDDDDISEDLDMVTGENEDSDVKTTKRSKGKNIIMGEGEIQRNYKIFPNNC